MANEQRVCSPIGESYSRKGEWWKAICQWPGILVCDRCKRRINDRNGMEHPKKVSTPVCANGCVWFPCGPKQNDWAIGLELPGVQVTRPPWVFAIGPVIGTFDWTPRYPNKCSGEG